MAKKRRRKNSFSGKMSAGNGKNDGGKRLAGLKRQEKTGGDGIVFWREKETHPTVCSCAELAL